MCFFLSSYHSNPNKAICVWGVWQIQEAKKEEIRAEIRKQQEANRKLAVLQKRKIEEVTSAAEAADAAVARKQEMKAIKLRTMELELEIMRRKLAKAEAEEAALNNVEGTTATEAEGEDEESKEDAQQAQQEQQSQQQDDGVGKGNDDPVEPQQAEEGIQMGGQSAEKLQSAPAIEAETVDISGAPAAGDGGIAESALNEGEKNEKEED